MQRPAAARLALLLVLLLGLLVPPAAAHAPRFVGAGSADAPVLVEDARKSWAFYGRLDAGGEAWFAIDVERGDRILASVLVPASSTRAPRLALLGPGPPDGEAFAAARVDEVDLEPFTPSALRAVARLDLAAPEAGRYLLRVEASPGGGGPFALAVGYAEEFSAAEWVLVAWSRVETRMWEGRPLWLVLLLPATGAAASVAMARARRLSAPRSLAAVAGGVFAGSGALLLFETWLAVDAAGMGPAALVPVGFALVDVALAVVALRVAFRSAPRTRRTRAGLAFAGALALVTWSGLLLAPLLCAAAAAWPASTTRREPI